MARTHLTSGERLQAYEAIFLLNQQFHLIVCRLSDLGKLRTFNPTILYELKELTQEMQAEINHHLLEKLSEVENKDWHSFGKVRARRNKLPKSPKLPKLPKLKGGSHH